jgi:riboflavin biosynthesis pyrimidine reductase
LTGSKATRLYPLPAREIPAGAIYDDLELPPVGRRRDPSRPYVIINMVASVDGKTAVGGKASPLGTDVDRQTMRNLRSRADAVMIGANTLRAEKLSLGLDVPSHRPQPLAIIATKSGDVPLERNLILGEGQELILLSPGESESLSDYVNLGEDLVRLKAERGVDLLLVEGGPTLNRALVSGSLADELFLTLAPKLLGADASEARTILDGGPLSPDAPTPNLLSVYLADHELFLRYTLNAQTVNHL